MNYPKVSIIILNWNGLEDTVECLESLKKITYPNYEVIVVDNGSEGNDAQVLQEKFGDYIYLIQNNRNYGYAGGANIGIRYALNNSNPDYLLLLNNDTVVDPEFLTELVSATEASMVIGIAGPKIYCYDQPKVLQPYARGHINFYKGETQSLLNTIRSEILLRREIDEGQYNSVIEAEHIAGCCFLIKRCVLNSIGLLDESYFCYWEETDYCFRARKNGYKVVYVPTAKIWHKIGRSAQKVTGFHCYYTARNRFRFVKKHATKRQYCIFLIYFFCFYFWLATGYYLIYCHSLRALTSFYRGVKDGLSNSEASAKLYRKD